MAENTLQLIATTIQNRRKALGMTQDDAAMSLGIPLRTYARIEAANPNVGIGKVIDVLSNFGIVLCVEPNSDTHGADDEWF